MCAEKPGICVVKVSQMTSMRFLDLHLDSFKQEPEESFENYFTRFGSLTDTVFSGDEVTAKIAKVAFVQKCFRVANGTLETPLGMIRDVSISVGDLTTTVDVTVCAAETTDILVGVKFLGQVDGGLRMNPPLMEITNSQLQCCLAAVDYSGDPRLHQFAYSRYDKFHNADADGVSRLPPAGSPASPAVMERPSLPHEVFLAHDTPIYGRPCMAVDSPPSDSFSPPDHIQYGHAGAQPIVNMS